MSYEDILKTSEDGRYRVKLVLDEYPTEPYDDGQSPLLRIESTGYSTRAEHVGVGSRPTADDEYIEYAAQRWGSPSNADFRMFEKYLRAYFGVTQIETYNSGSYWYVTYDSAAFREFTGAPKGSASLEEYKAWIEGDTWFYVVEQNVTWHREDSDETMQTWETVDSVGGYYGYRYAEESALEAFNSVIEETKE